MWSIIQTPIHLSLMPKFIYLITSCKPIMGGDHNMLLNPRDLEFCGDAICELWSNFETVGPSFSQLGEKKLHLFSFLSSVNKDFQSRKYNFPKS